MAYAISLFLIFTFGFTGAASANPACLVCTVAIGAALEISRLLGVPDAVVGVWVGALFLITYYFTIKFLEYKKWTFRFYRLAMGALTLLLVPLVYEFVPYGITEYFGMDAFLVSMASGALVFQASQWIYQRMKAAHGGHAHFPFEKVVMALAFLAAASSIFYFI
jgi:hypothetical protein